MYIKARDELLNYDASLEKTSGVINGKGLNAVA